MGQVKTILAATDLSAPARHAAARALKLAHVTGAQASLVHVMNQGTLNDLRALLGGQTEPIERQLVERAREELVRLAASAGEPLGIAPGIHLAAGTVLAAILDHADAIDADLLVLGARGESFMRHLLLGSTAERLLRKTRRPILVVKQTPIDNYRRILVPVNFRPGHAEDWSLRSPSRRAPKSYCFTPSMCLSRGGCGWPAWRRRRSVNTALLQRTKHRGACGSSVLKSALTPSKPSTASCRGMPRAASSSRSRSRTAT